MKSEGTTGEAGRPSIVWFRIAGVPPGFSGICNVVLVFLRFPGQYKRGPCMFTNHGKEIVADQAPDW